MAETPTQSNFNMTDSTYQSQLAQLAKAMKDYRTNKAATRAQYGNQYAVNRSDTVRSRGLDQVAQADDYAGRGILRSGVFAKDRGRLNTEYATALAKLAKDKQNYLAGLNRDESMYVGQNQLEKLAAAQDAAARRAAQYATF